MKHPSRFSLLVGVLLICGCAPAPPAPAQRSASNRETPAPPAPRKAPAVNAPSPAASVQTAIDALGNNQPDVIWTSLPASYQKDVNGLVHEFAGRMDVDVWAHLFSTLTGITDVLEKKKDFILAYPAVRDSEQIDAEDLAAHWGDILGVCRTLLESDVSDLKTLQAIDVGDSLGGTGRKTMEQLSEFTTTHLAGAQAETVSQKDNTAVVRITFPTPEDAAQADPLLKRLTQNSDAANAGASREIELALVEGKWIPRELAEGWSGHIVAANARIGGMTPDFFDFFKRQWLPMLDSVDRVMATVQNAPTQEKFDKIVGRQVLPPVTSLLAWMFPEAFAPPVFTAAAEEPQSSGGGDVVTIVFESSLDEAREADVSRELMSVVDKPELGLTVPAVDDDGHTRIDVSPVRDVKAFASKIEFANVVKVDPKKRTITVQLGEGAQPTR